MSQSFKKTATLDMARLLTGTVNDALGVAAFAAAREEATEPPVNGTATQELLKQVTKPLPEQRRPILFKDLPPIGKNGPAKLAEAIEVAREIQADKSIKGCFYVAMHTLAELHKRGISAVLLKILPTSAPSLTMIRVHDDKEFKHHYALLVDGYILDRVINGHPVLIPFEDYFPLAFRDSERVHFTVCHLRPPIDRTRLNEDLYLAQLTLSFETGEKVPIDPDFLENKMYNQDLEAHPYGHVWLDLGLQLAEDIEF